MYTLLLHHLSSLQDQCVLIIFTLFSMSQRHSFCQQMSFQAKYCSIAVLGPAQSLSWGNERVRIAARVGLRWRGVGVQQNQRCCLASGACAGSFGRCAGFSTFSTSPKVPRRTAPLRERKFNINGKCCWSENTPPSHCAWFLALAAAQVASSSARKGFGAAARTAQSSKQLPVALGNSTMEKMLLPDLFSLWPVA